jgi:hypothetical protein
MSLDAALPSVVGVELLVAVLCAQAGAVTDIAIRLTPSAKIPLRSVTMLKLPDAARL